MFNFKKGKKDFVSVPEQNRIADIVVPTIPIKKYSEIIKKGTAIVEKLAKQMDNPEQFLKELNVVVLLKYVPQMIDVATDQFFSLLAYVLDVEISKVENLSGADLMRLLVKLAETNEIAEIRGPLLASLRGMFSKTRRK